MRASFVLVTHPPGPNLMFQIPDDLQHCGLDGVIAGFGVKVRPRNFEENPDAKLGARVPPMLQSDPGRCNGGQSFQAF